MKIAAMLCATMIGGALIAQRPGDRPAKPDPELMKIRPVEGRLAAGDPAPDFNLKLRGSENRVRLADFRGKRPVALVFGSYT